MARLRYTGSGMMASGLILAGACLFCAVGLSEAAEFTLTPSIAVSEEYTDNVFARRDNKRSDFITHVLPGLALKYNASLWDWDIKYLFDYRYYARDTHGDETNHNLDAKGHVRLIDDFLLLDISDTFRRVSLDVTRDRTLDSPVYDQTDSNTFMVSPYIQFHPTSKTTLKTGYRYVNTWYNDPDAIDKREHSGFLDVTYEFSPKLNVTAGYLFTRQNSINSSNRHAPYAGFRYEYADKSFLFAQGGFTWIKYSNGASSDYPIWSAGITHTFDSYVLNFTVGQQYPEDPLGTSTRQMNYKLSLTRNLERGSIMAFTEYSRFDTSDSNYNLRRGITAEDTRKYGGGITIKYDLLEKLNTSLTAAAEKYDHLRTGSYTRRIYFNPALTYSFPKGISVSLNYSFVDYYSPKVYEDNYQVNRVILEAKKTF